MLSNNYNEKRKSDKTFVINAHGFTFRSDAYCHQNSMSFGTANKSKHIIICISNTFDSFIFYMFSSDPRKVIRTVTRTGTATDVDESASLESRTVVEL